MNRPDWIRIGIIVLEASIGTLSLVLILSGRSWIFAVPAAVGFCAAGFLMGFGLTPCNRED